jgi:hypothetical protein
MSALRPAAWDVRPPQYGVGAMRGMKLAEPERPYNGFEAAENMLDFAGVAIGDSPHYDQAVSGFLIVDRANPHRRDAYQIPIAEMYPDGVIRVHPDAIEPAERALRLHPAGDDVRAAAFGVLDHYKRLVADAKEGESEPTPIAVDGTGRSLLRRTTPLARRAHAEALRARYQAEEKRRSRAHSKMLSHIGEAGRRRLAREESDALRQKHDMALPIILNR